MSSQAPVLVLITADPRRSHRASEALRIALGLVAGHNDVLVILSGPGTHLLDHDTDALVEGDDIARIRANLKALGVPLRVDEESRPTEPDWNDGHPIILASRADIVAFTRASRRSLIF